jgi:hypothetical protein
MGLSGIKKKNFISIFQNKLFYLQLYFFEIEMRLGFYFSTFDGIGIENFVNSHHYYKLKVE